MIRLMRDVVDVGDAIDVGDVDVNVSVLLFCSFVSITISTDVVAVTAKSPVTLKVLLTGGDFKNKTGFAETIGFFISNIFK